MSFIIEDTPQENAAQGRFVIDGEQQQPELSVQEKLELAKSKQIAISPFEKILSNAPGFSQAQVDVATGASGLMRGGANLISEGLGEKLWPSASAAKDSGYRTAGEFLDPVALAAFGGAGKAAQYIPKLGTYAKGIAGGMFGGGIVGGISEEGDIGTGALGGGAVMAALPPALKYGAKGIGTVSDVLSRRAGKVTAGKIMRDVAGKELQAINAALENAPAGFTAAQVTAGIDRDVWQALAKLAESKDKTSFYRLLGDKQELENMNVLAKLARGKSSEESAAARTLMKSRIEEHLGKVREAELSKAGIAGSEAVDQGAVIAENIGGRAINPNTGQPYTHPATGEPVYTGRAGLMQQAGQLYAEFGNQANQAWETSGRKLGASGDVKIARNIERGLENYDASKAFVNLAAEKSMNIANAEKTLAGIERAGLSPLDITPILNRIDAKLASKMTRTNPDEVLVLNTLKDRLKITGEGGITDPFALYNIRKLSVNQVIDQLTTGASPKLSKSSAAKVLNDIKPMIDDAIESAGGTKWGSGYMNKYSKAFDSLERVEVLDVMRKMYNKNPQSFVNVVRGESPEKIQKVMEGSIGFDAAFSNNTKSMLREIAGKVEQAKEIERMAKAGRGGLIDILDKDTLRSKLPTWINRWTTAANKGVDILEGKINKSSMDKIVLGMRSGKDALDVINTLPASEKNIILKSMVDYGDIASKYAGAGIIANQGAQQ